jgi:hypothetical protein
VRKSYVYIKYVALLRRARSPAKYGEGVCRVRGCSGRGT